MRKIMDKPEIISYGYEFCKADKEIIDVISTYHMLHFIAKGKGFFNGRELCAGQGFLCSQVDRVCYYPSQDDPWTYAWINFRDKSVYDEVTKTIALDSDGVFEFDLDKPYFKLIREMNFPHESPLFYLNRSRDSVLSGAALYFNIMSYLKCDSHRKTDKKEDSARLLHVGQAKKIIDYNCNRSTFSVTVLAAEMHLSRAYLRNLFSLFTGISPQQYILQVRMERAKNLLKNISAPIGVIATSVGYTDALQFSKIFKKYAGMSPREYRKTASSEAKTE